MGIIAFIRMKFTDHDYERFTKSELPAIIGMILLDILAPIIFTVWAQYDQPRKRGFAQ